MECLATEINSSKIKWFMTCSYNADKLEILMNLNNLVEKNVLLSILNVYGNHDLRANHASFKQSQKAVMKRTRLRNTY